jgi:hypothetical protein
MYLRICGSFKSATNNWIRKSEIRKSQKYIVRKSQIRKLSHLWKVRKSKKNMSAVWRICGPPTFGKLGFACLGIYTRPLCVDWKSVECVFYTAETS